MSKAFDHRSWGSGLWYDPQDRPHAEENRLIHVTEMNVSATADNRNSIMRVLNEMWGAPPDTSDPSRVDGSSLHIDRPHPDGDLAAAGCRVRGHSVQILNQYEALVTVRYNIPYVDDYWGAVVGGVPEMSVREATEWIEIPTIYTVTLSTGGSIRKVYGSRRLERTTMYTTISELVTTPNFETLGAKIGEAFELANKIDPNPIIGSDDRTRNSIILGGHLRADYNTSSAQGGPGRYAFVVQRRWTAPVKELPADGNRVAMPEIPANGEIVVALDTNGDPFYEIILASDNYESLSPPP